jgi:hypothetical protein
MEKEYETRSEATKFRDSGRAGEREWEIRSTKILKRFLFDKID